MDAITTVVALPMDEAEARVRETLATQGFGVLTEMDIAATLKAKLGVERPPLKVLGACNPQLANAALEADPSASLLLPCNVVLEPDASGGTRISAVDPRALLADDAVAALADDAAGRLRAALDAAGAG